MTALVLPVSQRSENVDFGERFVYMDDRSRFKGKIDIDLVMIQKRSSTYIRF